MYFPTIDTILNLLTTGLFIFYMKKFLHKDLLDFYIKKNVILFHYL